MHPHPHPHPHIPFPSHFHPSPHTHPIPTPRPPLLLSDMEAFPSHLAGQGEGERQGTALPPLAQGGRPYDPSRCSIAAGSIRAADHARRSCGQQAAKGIGGTLDLDDAGPLHTPLHLTHPTPPPMTCHPIPSHPIRPLSSSSYLSLVQRHLTPRQPTPPRLTPSAAFLTFSRERETVVGTARPVRSKPYSRHGYSYFSGDGGGRGSAT